MIKNKCHFLEEAMSAGEFWCNEHEYIVNGVSCFGNLAKRECFVTLGNRNVKKTVKGRVTLDKGKIIRVEENEDRISAEKHGFKYAPCAIEYEVEE